MRKKGNEKKGKFIVYSSHYYVRFGRGRKQKKKEFSVLLLIKTYYTCLNCVTPSFQISLIAKKMREHVSNSL